MKHIKIMRGNIRALKKPTDVVIIRDQKVSDIVFDKSNYDNSSYVIKLPVVELTDDNVLDYLEYYKTAIRKAKNKGLKTMAIEAIDLGDDDLNFSVAVEFAEVIKEAIGLTVGIGSLMVTLLCKDRELSDIYELAIYGEIRSSQVTMSDKLERNEAILIPTKKNILRFEKHYKGLKKREPRKTFLKCYFNSQILPGQYFLVEGFEDADYYFFVNLIKDNKISNKDFTEAAIVGIHAVIDSIKTMSCKNITIPIIRFMKKEEENDQFVKDLVNSVCDYIEELEVNVKFYCPYDDLWDVVLSCFEKEEDTDVRLK